MNTIQIISFFIVILCLMFNMYLLLSKNPSKNLKDFMKKGQLATFVLAIGLIFYFAFFVSSLSSINSQITVDDGSSTPIIISDNEYLVNVFYLQLLTGVQGLNVLFAVVFILMDLGFFGRGKFKYSTW